MKSVRFRHKMRIERTLREAVVHFGEMVGSTVGTLRREGGHMDRLLLHHCVDSLNVPIQAVPGKMGVERWTGGVKGGAHDQILTCGWDGGR